MLTIVQCVNNMDLGGLEQIVLTLSTKLKARGFGSAICCIENRGSLADEAVQRGLEVYALETEKVGKWRAHRALGTFLRQCRPNVIHSHNFKPFCYAAQARLLGATDAHLHTRHGAFVRHHRFPWRYRLLRGGVDDLVTVSAEGREALANLSGLNATDIGVLANGVDTTQFCPVADKAAVRRELNLPEDVPIIICVARLAPEKDLGTLLRAFRLILDQWPKSQVSGLQSQVSAAPILLLTGAGPERASLEAITTQLQLGARVRFLGPRKDVNRILQAADVFALSSISEGLSVALIEAAASGLPIVATAVGGNSEIVNPPHGGYLVPARDPAALADSLVTVLGDAAMRNNMGQSARQHAVSKFGVQQMIDEYVSRYQAILRAQHRWSKEERVSG